MIILNNTFNSSHRHHTHAGWASYLINLNLTTISLDFYSGAIMALGKGKENGINFELEVIDTKNDYDSIIKILKNNL